MIHVKIKSREQLGRYYCSYCDKWFDDPIWEEVDEPRGEYWGVPCTEHCVYVYCPYCKEEGVYTADEVILEEDEDEQDS